MIQDGYGVPLEERRQARLEEVNALRRRVRAPLAELAAGLKNGETAVEKIDALYMFMERLRLQEALEARMRDQAAAGRLQEAEETAQLWEILCNVLDQFVEISGPERMDADTFYRLFRLVLTQYSVGAIPVSLDQVSAGELTRNDRFPVKYLFLLGVNDHVIPAVGQNGGILNEDDREELAKAGVELAPTGMEQMGMELLYLYTALSRPTDGLVISYPISDSGGGVLRPAFVVERLRTLFPSLRVETPEAGFRLTAKIPALEAAGEQIGGPLWNYFAQSGAYSNALTAMERGVPCPPGPCGAYMGGASPSPPPVWNGCDPAISPILWSTVCGQSPGAPPRLTRRRSGRFYTSCWKTSRATRCPWAVSAPWTIPHCMI